MGNGDKRERTRAMSELLNTVVGWDRYEHNQRDMSWRVANSLAFALNGHDPEYFSGVLHSRSSEDIEIVAYTAQHLVYGQGDLGSDDFSFRVIPRRDISSLEVLSAPPVLEVQSGAGAQSRGAYKVGYGDTLSFSLPLSSSVVDSALDGFVPSLLDDLAT